MNICGRAKEGGSSSGEDVFEDVPKEWTFQDENREIHTYVSKGEMDSLLEGIDLLVDKDNTAISTFEEERQKCVEGIREMGLRIYSSQRGSMKAIFFHGAGFHIVLDS